MRTVCRATACMLAAAAALPAAAIAGGPPKRDPGSVRVVGVHDGLRITSSTAGDAEFRCIAAQGLASICMRHNPRADAPLLVFHEVSRSRALGRLVVAGLAGDDAVRIRIRVRKDVRELEPGRFGAYSAVFPATTRQRDLVISVRTRSGKTETTDYRKSSARWRPVAGSDKVDRTLTDPDGTKLGQLVWRAAGGQLCQQIGQLVGGRVGDLRGRVFNEYPINDGGSCVRLPLQGPTAPSIGSSGDSVTVSGFARSDVRTLEAQLPDGRVVDLPRSPRGAFGVVLTVPGGLAASVKLSGTLTNGSMFVQALGGPPPVA